MPIPSTIQETILRSETQEGTNPVPAVCSMSSLGNPLFLTILLVSIPDRTIPKTPMIIIAKANSFRSGGPVLAKQDRVAHRFSGGGVESRR